MTVDKAQDVLEILVDEYGLDGVLSLVGDVCLAKAEHIEASYDDRTTAGHWQRAALSVLRCAQSGPINVVGMG